MADPYWDSVWLNSRVEEYSRYINPQRDLWFFDLFRREGVRTVCDAACGFGAYSVMLQKQGFQTDGFDISGESVELTRRMLAHFDCQPGCYKECSITAIDFAAQRFDAAVAHAVLDHLGTQAALAVQELCRIVRPGGLVYLSFDPLEEADLQAAHEVLPDGSFLYTEAGERNGLRFKFYSQADIEALLQGKTIIGSNTTSRGVREVVIRV